MDIAAVNYTAAAGNANTNEAGGNTLGKLEFLKILAAELQNQDPINPVSNTEFVAQLAQFSSLEQLQRMTESMESLAIMQAAGLIGKQVTAQANGEIIQGVVESILIKDAAPHAIIGGNILAVNTIIKIG